jgi:hypothetical protein
MSSNLIKVLVNIKSIDVISPFLSLLARLKK